MTGNERQLQVLRTALLYGLGIGAALFCGVMSGLGNYHLLGLLAAGVACAWLMAHERFHLPMLIMLSMMPGRGLLLGGLAYWDAFALLVVASATLRVLMKRGTRWPMVGRGTWLLTAVFSGIFVGHVIANAAGVGTGSEGGFQTALMASLSIAVGYCILSGRLSHDKIDGLPGLGVIPGAFEGSLEIVNFVWPAAITVTYALYSNSLNWETVAAMRTGDEVSRLAGLRALGFSLGLLCSVGLVYVPRLFSLRGAAVAFGLLSSLALVLVAGYRSYVLAFVMCVSLAALARKRFLLAIMALLMVGIFGGMWVYNNEVAPLPRQMQRILCWLPGRWDTVTEQSANVGLEWRREVWTRFMYSTFPEHPWFGQGIRFFPTEAEGLSLPDTELFAVTQRTHSGFFSALDHVGMIGTAALILASLRAYWNCAVLLLARGRRLRPWMLWVVLFYASQQGWFWMTGDFRASFMPFALCMCLLEVIRKKVDGPGADTDAPKASERPVAA